LRTGPNANPADPLEPFNRGVSTFNDKLDTYALKPVATAIGLHADPGAIAVGNFFSNVSDVYSRRTICCRQAVARGRGHDARGDQQCARHRGLIDIATPAGLPKYKEDFGQTMGVWGVPAGPYLVLPLSGLAACGIPQA
jgi:phospholipid-binding lipoprotein MlaA